MFASLSLRRKLLLGFIVLVAACFASLLNTRPAEAYSGGRLIDDAIFRDSDAMSAAQIQSFLESKNSGLKNFRPDGGIECYGADSKERELYVAAGASCSEEYRASTIIYYAAKVYGVNPRVILATLQKEQSLITTTNPSKWQLSQAMGYGCPTTGSCESSSNFSYQIDSGTWVLRYHYERANGNNNWWRPSDSWTCGTAKNFYKPNLYPNQNVTFKDGNGVSYRTHFIDNAATSAFYCYTPHAYNNPQGLYGLPKYGTKGQYYTGSYNFVASFEKWFGSTYGGINLIKTASSDSLYLVDRDKKVAVASMDALNAWELDDDPISTLGSEAMGQYPTASGMLGRRARSSSTNTLYFVDDGKAHKVHTPAIQVAWALSNSGVPTIDTDTIETLDKISSLSYLVKYNGGGPTYLVENGKKLPIGDSGSLELIRGADGTPTTRNFSGTTINSLATSSPVNHTFKVGSQWYVFDYGVVRPIHSGYEDYWKADGPTVSSNILNFFHVAKEVKQTFKYDGKYYFIKPEGGLKTSTLKSTAERWGALNSPTINRRLVVKVD